MRVAWFPKASDLPNNPYWELLRRELERMGIEFETSHNSYWMTYRWLWQHRNRVDVLHFHFIQSHYASANQRGSLRRLAKFSHYLLVARLLGYRIVWTAHDLMPTWPMPPQWVEWLARLTMARLAHRVMVHCDRARQLLREHFGIRNRISVVPHPSYHGAYPNAVSKAVARESLGIGQDCFVAGFVGGIRPNKGIEELISTFAKLSSPDAVLLVAGKPWQPDSYVARVEALAAMDPRVRFTPERIPDGDLQRYLQAADVLVFPFTRVLTSGSVVLAMSFGRPVIVPRLGCLPELIGTDSGFVYDPQEPHALGAALERAMGSNLTRMGAAAANRVNAVTWRDLARRTEGVYRRP